MDEQLSIAAALINKARGTTFPAEREALAMRAYTQLASFLNALEAETSPGKRRRERRHLRDRRGKDAKRAEQPSSAGAPSRRGASGYTSAIPRRPSVGVHVDLKL